MQALRSGLSVFGATCGDGEELADVRGALTIIAKDQRTRLGEGGQVRVESSSGQRHLWCHRALP